MYSSTVQNLLYELYVLSRVRGEKKNGGSSLWSQMKKESKYLWTQVPLDLLQQRDNVC
jgi:hypothetical protein